MRNIKLGGLAEQFLQPLRILQAGHLDQDAVGALALDRRLDGAELVDAPLDDFHRLPDGWRTRSTRPARLGQPDQPIADIKTMFTNARR